MSCCVHTNTNLREIRGAIDYILVTPQLKAVAQLEMFSEDVITEERSLPSSRYPSDHMACLAVVEHCS